MLNAILETSRNITKGFYVLVSLSHFILPFYLDPTKRMDGWKEKKRMFMSADVVV